LPDSGKIIKLPQEKLKNYNILASLSTIDGLDLNIMVFWIKLALSLIAIIRFLRASTKWSPTPEVNKAWSQEAKWYSSG